MAVPAPLQRQQNVFNAVGQHVGVAIAPLEERVQRVAAPIIEAQRVRCSHAPRPPGRGGRG